MPEVIKRHDCGEVQWWFVCLLHCLMHMRSSRRCLFGAAAKIESYHNEMLDEMKQCYHPALKDACRAANETLG
jgi:hypothetical protein